VEICTLAATAGSTRGSQAAPVSSEMNRAAPTSENSVDNHDGVRSDALRSRGNAGVIMHASLEGEAAFASENRALSLRLAQHEFPIQIVPVSGQLARINDSTMGGNRKALQHLLHDRLDLAESVLYQSGAPTAWNLDFYGRCRVGRTEFGTDRIPDGWAERCNAIDELWLPSEFHRQAFVASGVERSKIRIIPHAIDSGVFHPAQIQFQIASGKSFRFLAISDGILASGTDILIQAFIEEFGPDDDVSLIIHTPGSRCDHAFIDVEAEFLFLIEKKFGRKLEDVPAITLLSGSMRDKERSRLYAWSHAFVQPARAEANAQHCLEALACQVPVVATDWGPLSDFLNDRNSFPLATTGLGLTQPEENELLAGHRWTEPSLDQLMHQMREVFTHSNEAARRADQGRRDVLKRFEWRVVLPEWIRNFRRLLE
jgi:glycosyltransferase involved in cell wall biosynthesis